MAHVDSCGDARSCPRAFNTLVGTTAKLACYPVGQLPAIPSGNWRVWSAPSCLATSKRPESRSGEGDREREEEMGQFTIFCKFKCPQIIVSLYFH